MGFPLGYSELLLPSMLLRIALLLGYVRQLIFVAFEAIGLGDLLDVDVPWPDVNSDSSSSSSSGGGSDDMNSNYYQRHNHQLQSASAALTILEALPVVRYEKLEAGRCANDVDGCAVCLCEFGRGDEVRPLSNCRHVFHRGCLDRWVELGQRGCPLCRTPLLPGEMLRAEGYRVWASSPTPDSYYEDDDDYYSVYSVSSSLQNPSLILLDELFSSS